MRYEIGDKVRIRQDLNKCGNIDFEGNMNRWSGQIMTISGFYCGYYKMAEDHQRWFWGDNMIAGKAIEMYCNPPSDEELISLLSDI